MVMNACFLMMRTGVWISASILDSSQILVTLASRDMILLYDLCWYHIHIRTYTHTFTTTREVRTIKYALGVDIHLQTITITNNFVLT